MAIAKRGPARAASFRHRAIRPVAQTWRGTLDDQVQFPRAPNPSGFLRACRGRAPLPPARQVPKLAPRAPPLLQTGARPVSLWLCARCNSGRLSWGGGGAPCPSLPSRHWAGLQRAPGSFRVADLPTSFPLALNPSHGGWRGQPRLALPGLPLWPEGKPGPVSSFHAGPSV